MKKDADLDALRDRDDFKGAAARFGEVSRLAMCAALPSGEATTVISPKNPYDKASRYALHLDPAGVLSWLLGCVLVFKGWLNARTLTFPGQPDRTCDSVAHLVDDTNQAWVVPVEFQLRPDPKMFGRFLGYLGALWLELGLVADSGVERFAVAAIVVNLTGVGRASRDLRWRRARLRTCLRVGEANLSTRCARSRFCAPFGAAK